jgi:Helicase associated domain
LGKWVSQQRQRRKKDDAGKACGGMNADRISLLEDIGFVWALQVQVHLGWDAMYEQLKDFKKLNRHTNVSRGDPNTKVSVLLL